jgi:hypothetical protein
MTPVRALVASLIAAVLFGAGLFIATSYAGGRPHDLVPLLSLGRTPFSLWCFLAAWAALIFGGLGVLAAFAAFIAPEEDDDPRFRRRGVPMAAPIILIGLGLALAFVALRCGPRLEASPPVAVPVTPDAVAAPAGPVLLGDEPPPGAAPPAAVAGEAAFSWRYMDPLVRGAGALWSGAGEPFADEAENLELLCGKAWVAVTGSASEEGPPERNARRARFRTERAMARAGAFLAQHAECGETVVLGVDLGQHARVTADGSEGAATSYQRQVLVVARGAEDPPKPVSATEAEAELRAFLADPASRAALLAGREFPSEPSIIASR